MNRRYDNSIRASLGWIGPSSVLIAVVTCAFLLVPLAAILPIAFSSSKFLDFPPPGFSLDWFQEVLSDPSWHAAAARSVQIGAFAATIATLCGTAAALSLKRVSVSKQRYIRVFALLPLTLPIIVYALSMYNILGWFNSTSGTALIAAGHAVLAFPVAFMVVSAAQSSLDSDIRRASSAMGASWQQTLVAVELPLLSRSILAAFFFAFALSFDEVVIALYLAAPGEPTVPLLMFSSVQESVTPELAAVSFLLVAVALVLGTIGALLLRTSHRKLEGKTQ